MKIDIDIINCTFSFTCPKKWELMTETGEANVRLCNACYKTVHLATTQSELNANIENNLCTAFSDHGGMLVGSVAWDSHLAFYAVYMNPIKTLSVEQIREILSAMNMPSTEMEIKRQFESSDIEQLLVEADQATAKKIVERLLKVGVSCTMRLR